MATMAAAPNLAATIASTPLTVASMATAATREEIERASKVVGAHPFIAGIPLVLGGNVFGYTAKGDEAFAVRREPEEQARKERRMDPAGHIEDEHPP